MKRLVDFPQLLLIVVVLDIHLLLLLTVTGGGGKDGVVNIDIQSISGTITSSGSGYTCRFISKRYSLLVDLQLQLQLLHLQFKVLVELSQMVVLDILMELYQTNFRNVPTATYPVTVVQRDKLNLSNITGGTFAVGNTVTGSVSGATGTVTKVLTDAVFVNNVTGSFLDAQQENIAYWWC